LENPDREENLGRRPRFFKNVNIIMSYTVMCLAQHAVAENHTVEHNKTNER